MPAHLLLALALSTPSPLLILAEDAAEPWSRADGSGLANDMVRQAFAAAGTPIRLQVVPYARCKASVIAGQAVACLAMSEEPDLKGKVIFAEQPLYAPEAHLLARRADASNYPSLQTLPKGTVVGIVNGYEYPAELMALAQRGIVFDRSPSEVANLKKLAAGRVQLAVAMLDEHKTAAKLCADAGIGSDVLTSALTAGRQGSYIGFSLRHPDGERARLAFNEGFRKLLTRRQSKPHK